MLNEWYSRQCRLTDDDGRFSLNLIRSNGATLAAETSNQQHDLETPINLDLHSIFVLPVCAFPSRRWKHCPR
jgi:hypothetical protein